MQQMALLFLRGAYKLKPSERDPDSAGQLFWFQSQAVSDEFNVLVSSKICQRVLECQKLEDSYLISITAVMMETFSFRIPSQKTLPNLLCSNFRDIIFHSVYIGRLVF